VCGLPPSQRILTAQGYLAVAEVSVGEAVATGRGRLRPVARVLRQQVQVPLLRLRTADVHVLRATADQWVLCRRDEGLPSWLPLHDVRPGDLLAVRGGGVARAPRLRAVSGGMAADEGLEAREARETWWLDWTPVAALDWSPYSGVVHDLEVAEDHSYISDGIVLGDACGAWA
jgi:intein/homing endonuclease